jgi:hypothetical protein
MKETLGLLLLACAGCGGALSGMYDGMNRRPEPDGYIRLAAAIHTKQPEQVSFSRDDRATCNEEPTADLKLFCSATKKGQCNAIQNPDLKAYCRDDCEDIVDPGYRHVCDRRTLLRTRAYALEGGNSDACKSIPKESKFFAWCLRPLLGGRDPDCDVPAGRSGQAGTDYLGKNGRKCTR